MTSSRPPFYAAFFCTILCCVFLAGCGKEGSPVPKKTQDIFDITNAGLSPMGDCLVARGTVTGAIDNVIAISLELAPSDPEDSCPGCPFQAREYGDFSVSDIQLDPNTGEFLFSYCPSSLSPMYRWRLVGRNIYPGLPYATTTPKILVLSEE